MATRRFEATVQLDNGLIIPASAADGLALQSDGSGNATWHNRQNDALQAGVVASGDCALTITSTPTYAVAAGTVYVATSGGVLVRRATTGKSATAITYASAGDTRLDCVTCDSTGTINYLTGTQQASAGATLDNRTGAPTIPAGSQLLWDVLVASSGTPTSRDRRPWARGAAAALTITAGTTDISYSGSAWAAISTSSLQMRVECSGVPVFVAINGFVSLPAASEYARLGWFVDGAQSGPGTTVAVPSTDGGIVWWGGWLTGLAARSHLIAPAWASPSNYTITLDFAEPAQFIVEERLNANSNNGTT